MGTRSTPQFHTRRCPPSTTGPELFLLQGLCGITLQSLTGHTYTTHPGSVALFPSLCAPAATLWTADPPTADTTGDRGEMMPKRRNTRAHNTAKAITTERRLNDAHVAERNKPPPF